MRIILFLMIISLIFAGFNALEKEAAQQEKENAYHLCLQDLPRSECIYILED